MVDRNNSRLSIVKQCKLLGVSRSSYYFERKGESEENLRITRVIDEIFMDYPWYGSRRMTLYLQHLGYCINRKRVQRLMRKIGVVAIVPRPGTSKNHPHHKVYPYLLRGLEINRPNQVWCADITYLPLSKGFMYLVAIMDWQSRKILSWKISNSLETDFCVQALKEAISVYGPPEIFNTDQGCQFTSDEFTSVLKSHDIKISMDGKGRWMDNVFIERFWRSLKYECVYINEFHGGNALKKGLRKWINYYNEFRLHAALNDKTPDEVYRQTLNVAA
ncbi:integrase [Desulfoplanes formicivorans]|uniref:Integrase n=1 Tax=Desulfoplanes formicivorans TaxID=1592317 RepID=A0A194AH16_9BACT|nr:integrase [Desulfoplanes formicivorans]